MGRAGFHPAPVSRLQAPVHPVKRPQLRLIAPPEPPDSGVRARKLTNRSGAGLRSCGDPDRLRPFTQGL